MTTWFLIWALLLSPQTVKQSAQEVLNQIGDFTAASPETSITPLEQPFEVQSVQGLVIANTGLRPPLAYVLFEIKQAGKNGAKIRSSRTDEKGRFKVGRLPQGSYIFKATLNGFASVVGTIVVSSKAPKTNEIRIEMPLGT